MIERLFYMRKRILKTCDFSRGFEYELYIVEQARIDQSAVREYLVGPHSIFGLKN